MVEFLRLYSCEVGIAVSVFRGRSWRREGREG